MRFSWKGALGIVVSAGLLWWSLRGESFGDIWRVARAADGFELLLMVVAATVIFPLRAMRWAVILEPIAAVPRGPLWRCTAIGAMGNNLLPARAGEFARAYTLSREVPTVSFASALGSLALDRIVDVTAVALLFFASIPLSDFSPTATILDVPLSQVMRIAGVLATVPLLLTAFLAVKPERFERLVSAILFRLVPVRLHARLVRILSSVIGGVAAVRSPSRLARIFGHALFMWLMTASSFWIGFKAVGIDVPFAAALMVQGIIAFAVALPATPGFVGVFEASAVVGLALYGVSRELAVSFALVYHLLTFIPITVMGLIYFGRLGLRFRDLGSAKEAVR
jgi:uncharacterized protein (TIRG00374 family)